MRIGTDIDILLSSFKATDANVTPAGTETRAGLGFSKQTVFPSQGCWGRGMGSQARGAPGPESCRGRGCLSPHHPGGQLCFP